MANVKLNFPRDTAEVNKSEAAGYTIHVTRDDGDPISAQEMHALLAQIAADRPFASPDAPQPARHTYSFTGRDFMHELILWVDPCVNKKTLSMGRTGGVAWREALAQLRPSQDPQVVSIQSKAGAARLVAAGYLTRHTLRGQYVVSRQYAGYKMGWRQADTFMVLGVAFPMSMFEAQNNQPDQ